jgi:hypothetical protein
VKAAPGVSLTGEARSNMDRISAVIGGGSASTEGLAQRRGLHGRLAVVEPG